VDGAALDGDDAERRTEKLLRADVVAMLIDQSVRVYVKTNCDTSSRRQREVTILDTWTLHPIKGVSLILARRAE
jgi:hypothetical protein